MLSESARHRAEAVRHFNRFYTQHIGALHEHLQNSPFSLTEVRVLHALSRGDADTASALARHLGLDSGYLSRLLASFERRELISRRPSETDARQSLLSLTDKGRATYAPLDAAANEEVSAVLSTLSEGEQQRLLAAMQTVESLLRQRMREAPITLRAPQPGDLSWLVHRQAQSFAAEYGWNHLFEGMLAHTVAEYASSADPLREACWVAQQGDAIVGSVMVVGVSTTVARVSLLYVEPDVRRMGLGARLVDEAVGFAQRAGYTKLSLTTAATLQDARRLAERWEFRCAASAVEQRFGTELVVERWERELQEMRSVP
ncbi:GNAT family N-acetyltransferase [Paraburkholderia phosphatilytica]|uniref:GNAT family N-acetyltransferase n=1 Tax=Paraburkholderia phosphatilytica TaxID=2282883 RepID=UPI003B831820